MATYEDFTAHNGIHDIEHVAFRFVGFIAYTNTVCDTVCIAVCKYISIYQYCRYQQYLMVIKTHYITGGALSYNLSGNTTLYTMRTTDTISASLQHHIYIYSLEIIYDLHLFCQVCSAYNWNTRS